MSHFTYSAFNKDGQCLYVGRATRKEVWRRFAEHAKRRGAEWVAEAAYIEVHEHGTRESMRLHEDQLWCALAPKYNDRRPGFPPDAAPAPVGISRYTKDSFGRWHTGSQA
jgi:hypothetical protein